MGAGGGGDLLYIGISYTYIPYGHNRNNFDTKDFPKMLLINYLLDT
jgi:hypothetical protein